MNRADNMKLETARRRERTLASLSKELDEEFPVRLGEREDKLTALVSFACEEAGRRVRALEERRGRV